jgi:hypothetical protein
MMKHVRLRENADPRVEMSRTRLAEGNGLKWTAWIKEQVCHTANDNAGGGWHGIKMLYVISHAAKLRFHKTRILSCL